MKNSLSFISTGTAENEFEFHMEGWRMIIFEIQPKMENITRKSPLSSKSGDSVKMSFG